MINIICDSIENEQKTLEIEIIVKKIYDLTCQSGLKKITFVHGDFNILHSGHLRFLDFSASCGDFLVVAVNGDKISETCVPENIRLISVEAVECVGFAFILNYPVEIFINALKPYAVIKGNEFKEKYNIEKQIVDSYGGKLIFSSGEIKFSNIELLRKEFSEIHFTSIVKPTDYFNRHNFNIKDLIVILNKFSTLNVVVVGDLIIDEYIFCDALGMSQEDPTIVVKPIKKETFVGGAGIVAAHISKLGANVKFFTCANKDSYSNFALEKLQEYGVKTSIIFDETRQTIVKQRYHASGKTLLRVNNLQNHDISYDLCKQQIKQIKHALKSADLLIFSDFNYGALPQMLVDEVTNYSNVKGIKIAADSQSSSQFGNISRYKNIHMITPTEREARLALQDFKSGIACLIDKLIQKTKALHVLLKLGSDGIVIGNSCNIINCLKVDKLPAFNYLPRDVSGAGDSLLACTAMSLGVNADIWQAAYMGSIAAACQVSKIGNVPLRKQEFLEELTK